VLFRQGLRVMLERAGDVEIAGEGANGQEVLDLIEAARPAVAVLDIRMPGMDGLEVGRHARRASPETGLVILTMHDDEDLLDEALGIGITGYVLKDDAVTEVVTCVRTVASGGTHVSPRLTRTLLAQRSGRQQDARSLDRLTRAERQGSESAGRRGQQPRDRRRHVHQRPHGRESPLSHLPEARNPRHAALVRFAAGHRDVL
jgi:DNA-binding NarL/FixJ family response regulator